MAEGEILKKLDNENIVKYFGSSLVNDELWIIMDFCAGGSVADILRERTPRCLAEDEIAVLLVDVVSVPAVSLTRPFQPLSQLRSDPRIDVLTSNEHRASRSEVCQHPP